MAKTQIVAGLEIARSKLRMVVGEVADNNLNILYASQIDCPDGIKNGAVVNLDRVTEAIVSLLEDIQQKIDKKVNSVFVNISGFNIRQETVNSVITLPQRGCEITKRNIDSLVESCRMVSIPLDRHLLYILPLEYIVDGQDGIEDPIGLCGSRLEARILIITAPFNHVQNIIKAINYSGLETEEVVLTPLANTVSILTAEERKKGVLLIDFKKDMSEIAVVKNDSLVFFESLPKGQDAVEEQLSARLNTPFEVGRELKTKYGFIDGQQRDTRNQEQIPIEWMGSKNNILRGDLNKIIHEQADSIFTMVMDKFKNIRNFNNIVKKGAVITGGVISMEGFLEAAAHRFGFTVRAGAITLPCAESKGSEYAVAAGLAFLAFKKKINNRLSPESNFFKKMYQKADEILTEYF